MGRRIAGFRELRVYQAAFAAAMEVRELVVRFPRQETYGLSIQMLRASRSVCANTAEAWRKRRYPRAFVAKLSDAEAEAAEMQVFLDFALASGYIDEAARDRLDAAYDGVIGQLVRMANASARWATTAPTAGAAGRP